MTQPSRAAGAFLTLFGLPFFGAGLALIFQQLSGPGNHTTFERFAGALFGSVFAFIGGGLMYAGIRGYRYLEEQAAREKANPLSPWLWRTDWASRRANSLNRKSQVFLWVAAIFCNVATLPFLVTIFQQFARFHDPRVLLLLFFNLIGVILAVSAIRTTIRHRRFGETYFEFDSLPFSTGDQVRGRIHLHFDTRAEHGIDLRLTCVRKITTGSGDSRSTNQVVLRQADQNVPAGALLPGPLGRSIPVDFPIPVDSPITNQDDPRDQVLWLLHARADVPGIDYKDDFEIPVFRGASSAQPSADSGSVLSSTNAFGFATATFASESGEVPKPSHTKVVVSIGSGGTEFYFPPLRTPGRAAMLFLFGAIWTTVVYLLYVKQAPAFFLVVFGLSDLLILAGFLHVGFGSARITVRNGEIFSRAGLFGMGQVRRIPVSDVESVIAVVSSQQNAGSTVSGFHAIRLRFKNGRKITLADEIDSRQEARWVVSEIETLAGLKLDTHVEVELPLGVAAQLPGQTTGQLFNPPRHTNAAAPLAIFMAFVTAMMGFMIWRMTSFSSRNKNSRTAAAAPQPVTRRVFSGPMTDADVQRVLALPAQAQAEELLERAIGHDLRARELFEQNVREWRGHINMTDRMRQLDQRSTYSNDLRIRLANAAINLALEGWNEDEEAADLLIKRAQNDQNYRAAAVFYLGMLAGRGVAYDRIHPILWEYARYDQDAAVRTWAVEGMRFLGKDEVLDELFISFTEDPVNSVRDRAGCNISDCGIFTRKQRMRMVPKLIDLARDPGTAGQMRSWTFLALQEITDVHLPADPVAWSRWYLDHGAEKMAEFERLEWYQVRGDE